MTVVRKQVNKGQVKFPDWADIQNKPEGFNDLGLTSPFPFLQINEPQGLSAPEQLQGRVNLGLPEGLVAHPAVSLGLDTNGLTLNEQVLQLSLATTGSAGAMSSSDKTKLDGGGNISQGSGLSITGTSTGRLLSTGNVTFAVDGTVLRTTGAFTITGQHNIRRAGPNDGSSAGLVKRYEIGPDNLYKLDLLNTQNVQDTNGEVQWLYAYTSNAGSNTAKQRDMVGFARGAVTILGGRAVPASYYNSIVTEEGNNEADPSWRYPLRQYAYGVTQAENLIIGEGLHVPKITGDTKLYVDGGIRTGTPSNGNQATVRLGDISVNTASTATHHVKCEINGVPGSILFIAD
jgi:hypothetical protein